MIPSPKVAYPKRPAYFACGFVRLLTKKTVANELGPQAFTLLTVIAMTEDARGYTDPVTFFNEQLLPLVGLGSVDALDRVRARCVAAGWLHYVPGGRRTGPGRYFVTVPDRYAGTDDAPTDEPVGSDALLRTHAEQTAEQTADQNPLIRTGAEQTAEQSAEQTASKPRNLLPIPFPSPEVVETTTRAPTETPRKKTRPKTPKPDPEADPRFVQFWTAYPRKVAKDKAARAMAAIDPSEVLLAEILAAVSHQKRAGGALEPGITDRDGRCVIPHPGTWLNGRRWRDDAPGPNPPAATADRREDQRAELRRQLALGNILAGEAEEIFGGPLDA